ncbi:MAG: membrane protein insertase YidC [Aquabacterium sp.]
MTDIRRTLLWVVFTMSMVLLWDAWLKHTGQPTLFGPSPAKVAPATPSTPAPVGSAAIPAPAAGTTSAAGAALPSAASVPQAAGAVSEKVVVTTDLVKATLDTRGGSLIRLELLAYRDATDPKRNVVLLDDSPGQRAYLAQSGLISLQAGAQPWPTHQTVMAVTSEERTLKDGAQQLQVRFESADVGGVRLAKTYTFKRGDYTVDVRHEITNAGAAAITPHLYLQLVRDGNPPPGESAFYSTFTGPAIYTEQAKFEKVEFKDIEKGKASHVKQADNGWVAVVQHYFASAWLVTAKAARDFRTEKVADNLYRVAMVLPQAEVAPGATVAHDARLLVGPQEEKKLEALAPGLELVKDYGWLTILSKPLFWLLDQMHRALGNWGWAIVALVVLLKIAFYWLNASAYRSMAKMKAINPRVMEMRERLKDNPQQMQQEMMRIYKEEKVNPLGGCLPILVQIPFFIALYWVLLSSVEMRNAPWIGWIKDLSVADPFYILPLLMTGSTMLQTWLNPTPPDPLQAKMMWIMPLVFSVMFFFFPAGLVLYWLTNNLLSIAQQWTINRRLGVA